MALANGAQTAELMDEYETPSMFHIDREEAGPVECAAPAVHDATRPTLETEHPAAEFARLFNGDSRRLVARVLRLAAGLCADDQLPEDLDARLEVLADLQRLCLATEAEIDRLKLEVENELVLRVRAGARKARRIYGDVD